MNRLQDLMPKLISSCQFAFVKGRYILDNTLIAQEALFKLYIAKSKDVLLALKIDMHKAYDKINCQSIIKVMENLVSIQNGVP